MKFLPRLVTNNNKDNCLAVYVDPEAKMKNDSDLISKAVAGDKSEFTGTKMKQEQQSS